MRDIVDRLNDFANWHTSCACGNVTDEARMCMDAAGRIGELEAQLREKKSEYMLAHGIFEEQSMKAKQLILELKELVKEYGER